MTTSIAITAPISAAVEGFPHHALIGAPAPHSASLMHGSKPSVGTSHHRQLGYVVYVDRSHALAGYRGRVLMHRKIMFDLFGWGPHPCFFCDLELPFRTGRKQAGRENWGIEIDHIDSNRTNNAISNLAFVCPPHQVAPGMKGPHEGLYVTRLEELAC